MSVSETGAVSLSAAQPLRQSALVPITWRSEWSVLRSLSLSATAARNARRGYCVATLGARDEPDGVAVVGPHRTYYVDPGGRTPRLPVAIGRFFPRVYLVALPPQTSTGRITVAYGWFVGRLVGCCL